jgi:alpha-amylase/alpha-mannosidase (GH57 family)
MTTSSEPRVRARAAVVHLHLYQPPREDPWLGEVEREPEAAPDHDWSARVERTCYRLLVAARVLDADGRIRRVLDTLSLASFDVAPSLLGYMEEHAPATYAAIVSADRASRARLGHGNALAHPFDHVILPLVNRRDKVTQVRWGLRDFRRRFGRDAEGMWLPETAVDDETLDVLAEHGLRFTVVAPHQVAGMPATWCWGRRAGGARRRPPPPPPRRPPPRRRW